MDAERLHSDIRASLATDPVAKNHLGITPDPHWTVGDCSVTPKLLKGILCTYSSGSSFQLKSIKKKLKTIIFVEKKHNSLK